MICDSCDGAVVDGKCVVCGKEYSAEENGAKAESDKDGRVPMRQLKTNRKLWKVLIFTLLTLGIYPLVFYTGISYDINEAASRYDGKKTMNYCLLVFLVGIITIGIGYFVWMHKISGRIGRELKRRGIGYSFSSASYWLWGILGACIGIGPLVYVHKIAKAMDLIAVDYNEKG